MVRRVSKLSDDIGHDTPLRLAIAAKIAFPNGGVTATTLRTEAKRGKLVIARVGGKDFTTLNHIKRMVERCHVKPNRPDCDSSPNSETRVVDSPAPQAGLSTMEAANLELAAALTTPVERLKPSKRTLAGNTQPR
jgi:hypothetical protein